jgi:hypothetical protein
LTLKSSYNAAVDGGDTRGTELGAVPLDHLVLGLLGAAIDGGEPRMTITKSTSRSSPTHWLP